MQGSVGLITSYLEPPLIVTELAGQEGVERVVRFLLQAAIHENVNYFSFLLILKPKPTNTNRNGDISIPILNRFQAQTSRATPLWQFG